jgi:hypothetical protein
LGLNAKPHSEFQNGLFIAAKKDICLQTNLNLRHRLETMVNPLQGQGGVVECELGNSTPMKMTPAISSLPSPAGRSPGQ